MNAKGNDSLDPRARDALRRRLIEDLNACVVEQGSPVTSEPTYWGYDFAKRAEKSLSDHLTLGNAWNILTGEVRSLFAHEKRDARPSGRLVDLVGPEGIGRAADLIVSRLDALPIDYTFVLRLGGSTNARDDQLEISGKIRIHLVTPDDPLLLLPAPIEPATSTASMLANVLRTKAAFSAGDELLQIDTAGYARGNSDDSAAVRAISLIKQVLFLGSLLGVFADRHQPNPFGWTRSAALWFTSVAPEIEGFVNVPLPTETAQYLGAYRRQENPPRMLDTLRGDGFPLLKRMMNVDDANLDRAPILAAAEWAFDSAASKNQTMSFLQMCIGLEALLGGESDNDGLTSALADRCAYLVGEKRSSREKVREDFKELYKHRSKLVHGRKTRLPREAQDSLAWGTMMLRRLLLREMRNYCGSLSWTHLP